MGIWSKYFTPTPTPSAPGESAPPAPAPAAAAAAPGMFSGLGEKLKRLQADGAIQAPAPSLWDLNPRFLADSEQNAEYSGQQPFTSDEDVYAFLRDFNEKNPGVLIQDTDNIQYNGGGANYTYNGNPIYRWQPNSITPQEWLPATEGEPGAEMRWVRAGDGEIPEWVKPNPDYNPDAAYDSQQAYYFTQNVNPGYRPLTAPEEHSGGIPGFMERYVAPLIKPAIGIGLGALTGMAGAGMLAGSGTAGAQAAALIESGATGAAGGAMEAAALGSTGGGLAGGAIRAGANAGANMFINDASFEDALEGYLMGAGMPYVADFAASGVNAGLDAVTDFDYRRLLGDAAESGAEWGDPSWSADPTFHSSPAPSAGGNMISTEQALLEGLPSGTTLDQLAAPAGFFPGPGGGMLGGLSQLDQPDGDEAQPSELPEAPQERPTVTGADLQRYVKAAKTVYSMLGGDSPAGPQRRDGQTDEEFAVESQDYYVQYLDLDPATVAEHGAPGSPEALAYILAQADAVLAQHGVDPEFLGTATVEELQDALKEKTEDELEQLARALHARGALGATSVQGEAVDPFTGETEELGNAGAPTQGASAAYERGRARAVDTLAGMRGSEARSFMDELLGRDVDLFGAQAAQDARYAKALLEQRLDDEGQRKRRPGDDASPEYYQAILEGMSSQQLRELLRSLGGEDRARAALGSLLGEDA